MKATVVDTGVLYRNPYPDHRADIATHPNLIHLTGHELLCVYRLGQAFYSSDGRLARLRSTDGGTSWTEEGLVWDPSNDDASYMYSASNVSKLSDGTLLIVAQRLSNDDGFPLRFNPATGGLKPTDVVLLRSDDQGHTWSEPQVLDLPGGQINDAPSSVLELNDGRWFLGIEQWKAWNDPIPLRIRGFALFSHDRGKTWGGRLDYPSSNDTSKMYSHSRYSRLLDGRVCALQWTQGIGEQPINRGITHDAHFVISDPTGAQWSTPWPTGIRGVPCWTLDLGGETLLATYLIGQGTADQGSGVYAVLSEDDGKTWKVSESTLIWDASHQEIPSGKGNLVQLPSGDVIACWWASQNGVVHIRHARLVVK